MNLTLTDSRGCRRHTLRYGLHVLRACGDLPVRGVYRLTPYRAMLISSLSVGPWTLFALCVRMLLALHDHYACCGVREVAIATAVVVPMVPVLAVACSTVLFVVVSLVEFVGLDSAALNDVVYIGTIYAPFTAIYWQAKLRALRGRSKCVLPTASSVPKSSVLLARSGNAAALPR